MGGFSLHCTFFRCMSTKALFLRNIRKAMQLSLTSMPHCICAHQHLQLDSHLLPPLSESLRQSLHNNSSNLFNCLASASLIPYPQPKLITLHPSTRTPSMRIARNSRMLSYRPNPNRAKCQAPRAAGSGAAVPAMSVFGDDKSDEYMMSSSAMVAESGSRSPWITAPCLDKFFRCWGVMNVGLRDSPICSKDGLQGRLFDFLSGLLA